MFSGSGLRVLFFFAGSHRKGDVGSFLHELGHVDTLLQFDLQRSSEHDLSKEGLWQHVFQLLGEEEWILIASPPCETFSRVRHRHPGPRPVRSSFYPRGFPWLSNKHLQQVEQANYFIDQTVTASQLAWQYFLEHPEDLGATVDQEVPRPFGNSLRCASFRCRLRPSLLLCFNALSKRPLQNPPGS